MTTKAAKKASAVRQPPPKRTGKRGPRPLDAKEDFDKPVKVESTEEAGQRQADLPGMEDREIAEIERAAEEYAGIRDKRIAQNAQEYELKQKLLGLMKKHGKETYARDGVEVHVVHEKETVKVKLHKSDE